MDLPIVVTDMQIVWNVDVEWQKHWYYGWDAQDIELWGELAYPTPSNFEVRRYYLGEKEIAKKHSNVDPFTIYGNSFRRYYEFGYYDMLIWSNIDSEDGTQVVLIDEKDLDEVKASTTVSRAMLAPESSRATALYNQPEIFYSAYPRDIYISRNKEDYDYYNDEEGVWVKHINCTLEPLVYIYLVQVILHNNDGRVVSANDGCAVSAFANGTSVNTGHTSNEPCMVYFNTRMKKNINVDGEKADILGGKLTTYGLCDMDGYQAGSRAEYQGSRGELPNFLYVELNMSNGGTQALRFDITKQCQSQCHGGVITVHVNCNELEDPTPGSGSLFQPVVEDYDQLDYEIPLE